jgi:hypothetical protein
MRKYIFGCVALLAIAVVATWNVNLGSKNDQLSRISLANVEALAADDNDNNNKKDEKCGTKSEYKHREELCGSGGKKTDIHIYCYSRISGSSTTYTIGCKSSGVDCFKSVNTDNTESKNC